ncbi:MAG: YrrS family protein [Solibacillus sp.]
MGVNRKRFVTRSEYAEENKRLAKINKVGKYLNLYIVVAAALTVIILAVTIATSGNEEVASTKPPEPVEDVVTEDLAEEPVEEEALVEEPTGENTIVTVTDDPVVEEIQTNEAWSVHPTEQTGPHTSTFQKGHIDYEEKLAAIFSVTDLVQEESFVKSVKNNGSASSAIAVVTSKDGSKMYRVSIEWIGETGWKPVKLEVLKTLAGAY